MRCMRKTSRRPKKHLVTQSSLSFDEAAFLIYVIPYWLVWTQAYPSGYKFCRGWQFCLEINPIPLKTVVKASDKPIKVSIPRFVLRKPIRTNFTEPKDHYNDHLTVGTT